ncbi:MAG TPA: hypothetical protein VGL77_05220 [Armatimonadota bacterium]|jgi:hypothetical protein
MRSWTTFLVFGAIVLGVLVYSMIAQLSSAKHPVMRAAQHFFAVVSKNDAIELERLVDTNTAQVIRAGSSIVTVSFNETTPFAGAFVRQKAVSWGYQELASLNIDTRTEPRVSDDGQIATVRMINGRKIYLRFIANTWKVFYISRDLTKS